MTTYLNWIELSKTAFKRNIKSLGKIAGKSKLSICVKANAYGHGLKEIVSLALKEDSIEVKKRTEEKTSLIKISSV